MTEHYRVVRDDLQLSALLHTEGPVVSHCAFQDVNLTAETQLALAHTYRHCIFVGCTLPTGFDKQTQGCLFFPQIEGEYRYRSRLYSADELYEGYQLGQPHSYEQCFDGRVYRHYIRMGKEAPDLRESLARSLHDHSISHNLHSFLATRPARDAVGVMGGHAVLRTSQEFRQVTLLGKRLAEAGFLPLTGGGPGAMEATHLGAWLAGRTGADIDSAIEQLSVAPSFRHPLWLDSAMQLRHRMPQLQPLHSLGIPTWLYGHEPATPFATLIAKYFDNSIREDRILTIAHGGVIYTPGGAGTLQEIFQEAVQDHYQSFGFSSPMIFLGCDYWTREMPVWPLFADLVKRGKYQNLLLTLTDSLDEVMQVLTDFRASASTTPPA